jgi:hypothetical protein
VADSIVAGYLAATSSPTIREVAVIPFNDVGTSSAGLKVGELFSGYLQEHLFNRAGFIQSPSLGASLILNGFIFHIGNQATVEATLVEPGTGRILASAHETLDLTPPPASARTSWSWKAGRLINRPDISSGTWGGWVFGGYNRSSKHNHLLGGFSIRAPSGRWEAAVDTGRWHENGNVVFYGALVPVVLVTVVQNLDVRYYRFTGFYLHPFKSIQIPGVFQIKSPWTARIGTGLGLYDMNMRADTYYVAWPDAPDTYRCHRFRRLEPRIEAGLSWNPAKPLECRFSYEHVLARSPIGPMNMDYGGHGLSFQLAYRLF